MTTRSTGDARHCERYVTEHLDRFGHEQFPDNTHNTWSVEGFEHYDGLSFAEVKPSPDDVGAPSFKMAFHFDRQTDTVSCVAVYCREDGRYSLLSSDRAWTKRLPRELG